MTALKSGLIVGGRKFITALIAGLLLIPVVTQADAASDGRDLISKASEKAGKVAWDGMATLVVHESQSRNTDSGKAQIELVHTMDIKGHGYRLEVSSAKGKQTYGWDGKQFWAVVDGKPGNEDQVKEAKRQISDAFYRFSLPFVLADKGSEISYEGKDSVNGAPTDVVKISYKGGPVDSYWKTEATEEHADKHDAKAEEHANHTADKDEAKHEEHADHDKMAEGHDHHAHVDNQVYFYHFDKDLHVVKIYFSHHGDDSYETFLFSDFATIDGITREQTRKLIKEDGNDLYDTKFTKIEFSKDTDENLYQSPKQ